jgi:hypothetical protein
MELKTSASELPTAHALEIQELLIRYAYLIDMQSTPEEEFLSLFTDDAVLVSPYRGRFVGKAGLRRFAHDQANAAWGRGTARLRHVLTNFLVDGREDQAVLKAYLTCYVTQLTPERRATHLLLTGHYECDAERVDGSWKLKSRIEFMDRVSGTSEDMSERNYQDVPARPAEGLSQRSERFSSASRASEGGQ